MSNDIVFAKLSGSGNDFVCIDSRSGRYEALLDSSERSGRFARALCSRSLGVGADGLIFACEPGLAGVADIEARFFETDGSECELCGNGTACFTRWASANDWVPHKPLPKVGQPPAHLAEDVQAGRTGIRILTPAGVGLGQDLAGSPDGEVDCRPDGTYVRVCIPLPKNMQTDVPLEAVGAGLKCDYVETGIPHAIVYVDDVGSADVARLGPAIRHDERFAPGGVNASFVQVVEEGRIAIRTYEYGVEGETLACGTGSAAAAILTAIRRNWPADYRTGRRPVLVHARSGDVLRVYFAQQDDGIISDVCLETVVRFVYTGVVHPELARRALGDGAGEVPQRDEGRSGCPGT